VKTELDEKTAELNETRAVEIEMRNKLEEGQKSLNEFQKKQAFFHDKLGKLTYQNVTYAFPFRLCPIQHTNPNKRPR
jgi:structural maintenance of chromosome 4